MSELSDKHREAMRLALLHNMEQVKERQRTCTHQLTLVREELPGDALINMEGEVITSTKCNPSGGYFFCVRCFKQEREFTVEQYADVLTENWNLTQEASKTPFMTAEESALYSGYGL